MALGGELITALLAILAVASAMFVRRLRHIGALRGSRRALWGALCVWLGFLSLFLGLLQSGVVIRSVPNFVLFFAVLLYSLVDVYRTFGRLDGPGQL